MIDNRAHTSTPCRAMLLAAMVALAVVLPGANSFADEIPILLYHRFGPRATDSMMVRMDRLEWQLREIERRGYQVIPLRQLVDHIVFHGPPPPPHSIVITVDDGHRSVYTELLPVVLRHHIPVTLFIYPSAISNASYALTWQELDELRATGLFDVQSHTYWHPNFAREKRRLPPGAYDRFVETQLVKSKQVLEAHTGKKVDLLAWPFGIFNTGLEQRARAAGYIAAFTMERRRAKSSDDPMALPRFLITDAVNDRAFAKILAAPDGP